MTTKWVISGKNNDVDESSSKIVVCGNNVKVSKSDNCVAIGENLNVEGKQNILVTNDGVFDIQSSIEIMGYILSYVQYDRMEDFSYIKQLVLDSKVGR